MMSSELEWSLDRPPGASDAEANLKLVAGLNDPLRENLVHFMEVEGAEQEPSVEDFQHLFAAFRDAVLLVPVPVDFEEGDDEFEALSYMLREFKIWPGLLFGVVFTSYDEAAAFFKQSEGLKMVLVPGISVAGLCIHMTRAFEMDGAAGVAAADTASVGEELLKIRLAAVIIDVAGAAPLVLTIEELRLIADPDLPFDPQVVKDRIRMNMTARPCQ